MVEHIQISQELCSIILVGGKGTRLDKERKKITKEDYPEIHPRFWNTQGSKALAVMQLETSQGVVRKPMTDWHLDLHAMCPQVRNITLALGTASDIVMDYYENKYNNRYRDIPLDFITEKKPAGTLAPIIKLYQRNELPKAPVVYANGDNLIDLDFYACYLAGCIRAAHLGMNLENSVIIILALVRWEESSAYGTINVDFETGLVKGFKEKAPIEENVYIEVDGIKKTPINSGFSIILNPQRLFSTYLTKEVIETSNRLEEGALDYAKHESVVKYETLYGDVASDGGMVAVYKPTYWTDLGTEEKIEAAEVEFSHTSVTKRFY